MKKWFKENLFVLISSIFLLVFCFIIKNAKGGFEITFIKYVIYYSFMFLSVVLLPKNKITIVIVEIVRTPGYLLILIDPLLKSFFFIFITFLLPYLIIFLLIDNLCNLIGFDLTESTVFYLTLITSSIFIIEFYEKLLAFLVKITHIDKDKENKKNFIINLSKSLMNRNRIRFFTYLIYLIFLVPFSIIRLEDSVEKYNMSFLNAAFYSFSTFLAYEKIIQNLSLMKVNLRRTIIQLFHNSIFYKKE